MNITVDTKTKRVLEKILNVPDCQPIIQEQVDLFISHKLEGAYKSRKSQADILTELDT